MDNKSLVDNKSLSPACIIFLSYFPIIFCLITVSNQ